MEAKEYDMRYKVLAVNGHDVTLLEKYFRRDENQSPPIYLLCPNLIGQLLFVFHALIR